MKNVLIITCVCCLSIFNILAQNDLQVELKDSTKPDMYIDGEKYDYKIFELIDQSKIESVNVIKDEQALKEYNAPNGVVIIKTKKASQHLITVDEKSIKISDNGIKPVVIIDGKVSNQDALSKLLPKNIKTIEVFKGKKAIDLYNAPNGAIIVKTKNTK